MLGGLVFIMVLQAAELPAQAPPASPPESAAPAANSPEANAEAESEQAREERRRCSTRQVTGTRLQSIVRCRRSAGHQEEDTRDALNSLQRPSIEPSN